VSQLTMPLEVDVCLAWREGTAIRCFACKWKGLSSDSVALFNLQNFRCLPVLCRSKFEFKSSGSPSVPWEVPTTRRQSNRQRTCSHLEHMMSPLIRNV